MSYTVGLDFGTHQTKVCIENSSNPLQKIYDFFEFDNGKGDFTVLFPSIVQINTDDTLSYGFVDSSKCKTTFSEKLEKPCMKLIPPVPVLKLPAEPQILAEVKKLNSTELKGQSLKDQLKLIYNNKSTIDQNDYLYKRKHQEWKDECDNIKEKFRRDIVQWENEKNKSNRIYIENMSLWEKKRILKHQYRYYKLATYSKTALWEFDISPDIISVWYITYIIFLLREHYGKHFFTQMGVPSGLEKNDFSGQKKIAYALFIMAHKLADLYKTKDAFLSEKYLNLLCITKIDYNITEVLFDSYSLEVLPEAFAGLSSITQKGRIEHGMSLLIDIGGGTTDVVFFTITKEKLPNIHAVISFPKGLNYVFENYSKQNNNLTLWDIQNIFLNERQRLKNMDGPINAYHGLLKNNVYEMIKAVYDAHSKTKCDPRRLCVALKNRPVIFCGGGSMFEEMRPDIMINSYNIVLDKHLLTIPTDSRKNIDETLYTILATSYGLSIPLENDIKLTPVENMFDHLQIDEVQLKEYNYEHGLTDY